ncbi:MAG: hypothetical protein AAFY02_21485 [Pseudomonadota bacterium]
MEQFVGEVAELALNIRSPLSYAGFIGVLFFGVIYSCLRILGPATGREHAYRLLKMAIFGALLIAFIATTGGIGAYLFEAQLRSIATNELSCNSTANRIQGMLKSSGYQPSAIWEILTNLSRYCRWLISTTL